MLWWLGSKRWIGDSESQLITCGKRKVIWKVQPKVQLITQKHIWGLFPFMKIWWIKVFWVLSLDKDQKRKINLIREIKLSTNHTSTSFPWHDISSLPLLDSAYHNRLFSFLNTYFEVRYMFFTQLECYLLGQRDRVWENYITWLIPVSWNGGDQGVWLIWVHGPHKRENASNEWTHKLLSFSYQQNVNIYIYIRIGYMHG